MFVEPDCIIRGDLAHVRVGRFSIVKELFARRSPFCVRTFPVFVRAKEHKKGGTVLRPSLKHFNKGVAFVPLSIGEHCMIEDNCVVSAAQIGNYVHLGADSIIGRRAVIKGFGLHYQISKTSMIFRK